MTQILNLTPHDIHIVDKTGNVTHTFPASGQVVRLEVSTEKVENDDGIPTVKSLTSLDVSQFPPSADGVIVSAKVAGYIKARRLALSWALQEAVNWRDIDASEWEDEYPPKIFTVEDTVKDSNGAIIGTKFLVLN